MEHLLILENPVTTRDHKIKATKTISVSTRVTGGRMFSLPFSKKLAGRKTM
jgi:hypothetical protein